MARTNKYSSINFNDIYDKKINPTKSSSSSSSSSSASASSSTQNLGRTHGGMLVLTRPTPKPQPQFQPPPPPPKSSYPYLLAQIQEPSIPVPDQTRLVPPDSAISLRPLGRTGSSLPSSSSSSPIPIITQERERDRDRESPSPVSSLHSSPKPEVFVPPHLRPGFAGKEERLVQDGQKNLGFRSREFGYNKQGFLQVGSPNRYDENGSPKSGGYVRIPGGGADSDQDYYMNRPSSSGNRPVSSSGNRPVSSSGNRPASSSGNRYGSSYRSPHPLK